VLRHRPSGDEVRVRRLPHSHSRKEAVQRPRHAAAVGEGQPGRQAAVDYRRGCRKRSAGDVGGESPARHSASVRRQGARLWRPAKSTGVVAIVRVGAATEADMKQKKGRVEDALHATRAAVAEGILPGGGVACIRAIAAVETLAEKLKGDERNGAEIVVRALEKPVRTIAENSGTDGAVVADEVRMRGEKSPHVGYNANTGEYVDMFKAGIVDPTKVTRSALQNAASIASLMLTTEVLVTKIDEEEPRSKVHGAIK